MQKQRIRQETVTLIEDEINFACDFCGAEFERLKDANFHESECPKNERNLYEYR